MCPPLACSDYYRASAPSRAFGRRRAYPDPSSWPLEGGSDTKRFPCSTRNRLISLAPSFAPAASPQLRRSPSSWPSRRHAKPATKSAAPTQPRNGRALHPGPYPPDLSRRLAYGALTTGSCRIPSDLARRTQPVWQYQAAPALSALLPTLPVVSRIRLRSASIGLLRQPDEKVFHLLQLRAPHGAPCGIPSSGSPCAIRSTRARMGCGVGGRPGRIGSGGERQPAVTAPDQHVRGGPHWRGGRRGVPA